MCICDSPHESAPALLDALGGEVARRARELNARELAAVAWAFAAAGHAPAALLEAVVKQAARREGDWRPHDLAALAWALARTEHAADGALYAALAREVARLEGAFPQHELAIVGRAFAEAGHGARLPGVEPEPRESAFACQPLEHTVPPLEEGPGERRDPRALLAKERLRSQEAVRDAEGGEPWLVQWLPRWLFRGKWYF